MNHEWFNRAETVITRGTILAILMILSLHALKALVLALI